MGGRQPNGRTGRQRGGLLLAGRRQCIGRCDRQPDTQHQPVGSLAAHEAAEDVALVGGGDADGIRYDLGGLLLGDLDDGHGGYEQFGDKAEDVRVEGEVVVGDVEVALQENVADQGA